MTQIKSTQTGGPRIKIAVSMDFLPDRGFFLKPDLVDRLLLLGFEIVPLVYDLNPLDKILSSVSGVLLPGGLGDVDPELFGQKKKYDCVKIVRNRCDFESALLVMALERDLPLFGICWGFQMLNVHLGGTLIQDIRRDAPHSLIHESCETDQNPLHGVTLTEKAATIAGEKEIVVNSTHHQGIDKIAPNLVVEGRSSDGLIECISLPKQKFTWAVQWHPERLPNDKFIPAFREACLR